MHISIDYIIDILAGITIGLDLLVLNLMLALVLQ